MHSKQQVGGFSLVELLVVIAIVTILIGLVVPSIPGLMRGNKVTSGLTALSETLTLGRQYAISNNTYVWVLLSPPAATGQPLKVAVLASLSGTDSLSWTPTAVTYPSASLPGSDLQLVSAIQNLSGINIQNYAYNGLPFYSLLPVPSVPPSGAMTINITAGGQSTAFTSAIQFTPSGEALVSSSMARYIEFAAYPQQGGTGTTNNSPDQAVLCVAGTTGATTIYRN